MTGRTNGVLLRVQRVTHEADAVVSVDLVRPDGGPLPGWTPGAHVEIRLDDSPARPYSLCGSTDDPYRYRVAVLRHAGGLVSRRIHDTGIVGRTVAVTAPRNRFVDDLTGPHHLLLAGGVGITPILPMARALHRTGQDWHLLYCGRSVSRMAFLAELENLPSDRVRVWADDRDGRADLAALVDTLPDRSSVYCCGPPGMIDAAADACTRAGRDLRFLVERFTSSRDHQARHTVVDEPFEVELASTGERLVVPGDRSVLQAVRERRPDVQYSCEEGFCGSCETRVLGGIPDHRDELLTDAEHAAGRTMLICVSRALQGPLVLDL